MAPRRQEPPPRSASSTSIEDYRAGARRRGSLRGGIGALGVLVSVFQAHASLEREAVALSSRAEVGIDLRRRARRAHSRDSRREALPATLTVVGSSARERDVGATRVAPLPQRPTRGARLRLARVVRGRAAGALRCHVRASALARIDPLVLVKSDPPQLLGARRADQRWRAPNGPRPLASCRAPCRLRGVLGPESESGTACGEVTGQASRLARQRSIVSA